MLPYKNRKEIAEYFGVDIGFIMGTQSERVRKHPAVERQVIASWYKPEEKLPPAEYDAILLTVSGRGNGVVYDHAFAIGGYDPKSGWYLENLSGEILEEFAVNAWCDIEPYKG